MTSLKYISIPAILSLFVAKCSCIGVQIWLRSERNSYRIYPNLLRTLKFNYFSRLSRLHNATSILKKVWKLFWPFSITHYNRNPSPSATTCEASGGKLASLAGFISKMETLDIYLIKYKLLSSSFVASSEREREESTLTSQPTWWLYSGGGWLQVAS